MGFHEKTPPVNNLLTSELPTFVWEDWAEEVVCTKQLAITKTKAVKNDFIFMDFELNFNT